MKLGSETGNAINHVYSSLKTPEPEVGMGATILCWSDRHAATIVKVTKCQIHVQQDKARIVNGDIYSGCSYAFERDENAPVVIFRKTKRGWRNGGYCLLPGRREEYYDPSF